MGAIASQITSLTIVYSTVYSRADPRKHQSFASLAFVWGIHRWPVTSPAQMASNAENVSIWWRHHKSYTLKPLQDRKPRLTSGLPSQRQTLRKAFPCAYVIIAQEYSYQRKIITKSMLMKIDCLGIHTCFASPTLWQGNPLLDYHKKIRNAEL